MDKRYGGVHALRDVSLAVGAGTVHGLVGANGAGKSTLIRILAGAEQPDAGTIRWDGRPVALPDTAAVLRLGFGFVHQELNLVEPMTALQNLALGLPEAAGLFFDRRRLRRLALPVAERLGIADVLDRPVRSLPTARRWLVAIAHALLHRARLIVMDEPTASLSAREADILLRIVRELAAEGVAILYVSHRLDEITALCDEVTALRDGRVTLRQAGTPDRAAIVAAIVGQASVAAIAPAAAERGAIVLRAKNLRRGKAVRDVSLDLNAGEVLGLAGLVGAGRSETARLLFGADRPDGGTMQLDGKTFTPRSPADAVAAGVALVPEERRSEGLFLDRSVGFNATITVLGQIARAGLVSPARRRITAETLGARLLLKAASPDTAVRRLSGGNQQKVVLAKWLAARPRVLILDEPTRGVDVGARAEIHRIVRGLAAAGMAVLVISSEPDELPELADRALVMAEGRIVAEFSGPALTRAAIIAASYGRLAA